MEGSSNSLEETQFFIHISDGYTFRNMIGLVKSEIDRATMILSPTAIEISFLNNSKCATHKIILNTSELSVYHYNIRDENGELLDEYPITFETNEFYNTTKGIGRKDGIRIYWLEGDKINVQPIKTGTKDPGRAGAIFVNILNIEPTRFIPGSYSSDPNVRIQSKEFADICSQVNTLKCSTLEILGEAHSVTFKGILPNNNIASVVRFVSQNTVNKNSSLQNKTNNINDLLKGLDLNNKPNTSKLSLNLINSEEILKVRIPISTVKALSKIHNISPTGTLLRFYFSEGRPHKLESPIGIYGLYTIYLKGIK